MENKKVSSSKLYPCLWFEDNAEEAVNFYTSLFKNSAIKTITRYGKGAPLPEGTALTILYELEGQTFMALNGGPAFKFNEAVSFVVNCDDQKELDNYWDTLLKGGGKAQQCGWLKDKYGLSWQIVPTVLEEMMQSKDAKKTGNMMKEMMQMVKLDIAKLEKAFNQ